VADGGTIASGSKLLKKPKEENVEVPDQEQIEKKGGKNPTGTRESRWNREPNSSEGTHNPGEPFVMGEKEYSITTTAPTQNKKKLGAGDREGGGK